MAVNISTEGVSFSSMAIADCLRSMGDRAFVTNSGDELVFTAGDYSISMKGAIAARAGDQPVGWDLNNTQINSMTFSCGGETVEITGLTMSLREIYHSRTAGDLRDWNDFSKYQDYRLTGTDDNDVMSGVKLGENDIRGGLGDDRLISNGVDDVIYGGGGDDVIVLRSQKAFVNGGAGSDTFVFASASDDLVIKGFEQGHDVLKLTSLLDDLKGWQDSKADDLRFIGNDDFHGNGFEIRYDIRKSGGQTETILEVNLGGHEHVIATLQGAVRLDADDLIF